MSSRIASRPVSLDRHICSHRYQDEGEGESEGEHALNVTLTLASMGTYVAVKVEWT